MTADISDLLSASFSSVRSPFIHCPGVGSVLRVGGSGLTAFLEKYPE